MINYILISIIILNILDYITTVIVLKMNWGIEGNNLMCNLMHYSFNFYTIIKLIPLPILLIFTYYLYSQINDETIKYVIQLILIFCMIGYIFLVINNLSVIIKNLI